MATQNDIARSGEKETARVEAFSDGVFAIAITLLVLDIKVPQLRDLAGRPLSAALLAEWPTYLAYVTSFFTVLVKWISHHKLFTQIARVDHRFLIVNGLLLMVICVVPFSTSLAASYLGRPYAKTAALVYSAVDIFIGIAFNLVWRYACTSGRLMQEGLDRPLLQVIGRQYALAPFLYLAAFIVAFISAEASVAFCCLLAVLFALA